VKVLFTGGGTGGHVYPALAVIESLRARPEKAVEVAWVGRPGSVEQGLVEREGIRYFSTSAGALRGRSPLQAVASLAQIVRGVRQGMAIIRAWKPDVVFSTGGYVTAPLMLAAWMLRAPAMIYLPDMEPGLAVRLLACLAQRVCVSFDSVAGHLPQGKVRVTGYPVRKALLAADRGQARARLSLDGNRPVLLVLGGSTGAHSINEAVSAHLEELLALAQIVHVSGPADAEGLSARGQALDPVRRADYRIYAYMHEEMADALVAADLVVARAGASTLAEFPAVGLPAILVPYPYAGQHQQANAEYLAVRGGAEVLADRELAARLPQLVRELLSQGDRLRAMSEAMRAIAVPEAASRLAQCVFEIAGKG